MTASAGGHPVTPDGRYFVVRGRLWRMVNPQIAAAKSDRLVRELMDPRRAVKAAKRSHDETAETAAHAVVDATKRALGERGAVWSDGATDYNRHMARNTPYAEWLSELP